MGVLYFGIYGCPLFRPIYFVLYFDLWVSFIFLYFFPYFLSLFRLFRFISSLFREAMKRIAFSFMKPT